jgi:energy-coupling factor transporter ATP-binding protein EcfA2
MMLVVLIGASGSGKTTTARAIAARCGEAAMVFHFDSIGVPSVGEMVREYGTGEAWQRAKTIEWMRKLARETEAGLPVLFEGQTRFSFLADGSEAAGGLAYDPVLVDCDDETRSIRLRLTRKQPELDNEEMVNWARYLRRQARRRGHPVLDTSALSLSESVERVLEHLASGRNFVTQSA